MPTIKQLPLNAVCELKPPKAQAKMRLSGDDSVSFIPMEDLGNWSKNSHSD
jgi:type I restriction enzyme S subunit